MKAINIAMAMTMMIMAMANFALAADTVDIGLGTMDRAEFETLRQMVRGDYQPTSSVSTETVREIRVAEFNVRDIESIRQAMAADRDQAMMADAQTQNRLVDIGLGSMSTSEFCDLNKLVASNTTAQDAGLTFICP